MQFSKRKLTLALAGLALFGAQSVSAGPQTGDTVMVGTTADRVGSGGPFKITGGTYAGASFETFCLETNEYLSLSGVSYTVKVNTGAVNGGVGSRAMYDGDVAGTAIFDPISKATGWLYSQYRAGGYALSGWTNSPDDKAAVQTAIWYLENESGLTAPGGKAGDWIGAAIAAVPSYAGGTYVMNLTASDGRHQDLLAIPEPETYAMLLAGLGLMGFIVRRRKQRDDIA